jgi:hypothetical protein
MRPSDLVMHDWRNMTPEEREQAIRDVRTLAESTIVSEHRRGRALNIIASFFQFVSEGR